MGAKWLSEKEAAEILLKGRQPGNITPIGAKVFLLEDNNSYIFLANELLVRYYLEEIGATFVTRLLSDKLPKKAGKVYRGLIDYLKQKYTIPEIRGNFSAVRKDIANFLLKRRKEFETAGEYRLGSKDTPVFWFWVEAGQTLHEATNSYYGLAQDYEQNRFKIHDFLFGMLRALVLAKAAGLLVLDLKIDNLIMSVRDSKTIVILNDFDGSVIVPQEYPFFAEINSRTWQYAAPEQLFDPNGQSAQGVKSFSTDLFAAGMIAYECLDFGNQPAGWGKLESERRAAFQAGTPIREPRNGDPVLRAAVMKALSINPDQRGDVQDLMQALTEPAGSPAMSDVRERLKELQSELEKLKRAEGESNVTVNNEKANIKKQYNGNITIIQKPDTPDETALTTPKKTTSESDKKEAKKEKELQKTERHKQMQNTIRLCIIIACVVVCLAFVLLFFSKPASAGSASAETMLSVSAETERM